MRVPDGNSRRRSCSLSTDKQGGHQEAGYLVPPPEDFRKMNLCVVNEGSLSNLVVEPDLVSSIKSIQSFEREVDKSKSYLVEGKPSCFALADYDALYIKGRLYVPHKRENLRMTGKATKIGKINLAATGKDLMDDKKQQITIDLYTTLEMENDIIDERATEIEKNQKLGLLLRFLSVHDWDHAQLLFQHLVQLNPV
ncbi:hypothetical protein ZWY2020_046686 [Hordeum vulgare]|nr:hypothetical protein ZWY2020_046686 [Hordeum vulgare]